MDLTANDIYYQNSFHDLNNVSLTIKKVKRLSNFNINSSLATQERQILLSTVSITAVIQTEKNTEFSWGRGG
jgi:hypothetical protein